MENSTLTYPKHAYTRMCTCTHTHTHTHTHTQWHPKCGQEILCSQSILVSLIVTFIKMSHNCLFTCLYPLPNCFHISWCKDHIYLFIIVPALLILVVWKKLLQKKKKIASNNFGKLQVTKTLIRIPAYKIAHFGSLRDNIYFL